MGTWASEAPAGHLRVKLPDSEVILFSIFIVKVYLCCVGNISIKITADNKTLTLNKLCLSKWMNTKHK